MSPAGIPNVAATLARAADAVHAIETYVAASHAVGHPPRGMTVADVQNLYAAEAGLRLDALDSDSEALARLADVAEESLRLQTGARDAIGQAWLGSSGSAATDSLDLHLDGGAALVAALRDASAALRSLREELAGLVEQKVSAAESFDERWGAEHPVWRAEAEAVLDGLADDIAVAVVAHQISPYVHGDVQTEFIPAMRAATDSVATAYDDAVTRLNERPAPPAAAPQWGSAAAPQWGSAAAPQWGSAAAPQWPALGSGLPSGIAAGMPDFGGIAGGLPGLFPRIADTFGSLTGPRESGLESEMNPDRERRRTAKEPVPENVPEVNGEATPEVDTAPKDPATEAAATPPETDVKPVGGQPVSPPVPVLPLQSYPAPQPLEQPAAVLAAPSSEPLPPPLAAEVGAPIVAPKPARPEKSDPEPETPCSIAADELPQVGQ